MKLKYNNMNDIRTNWFKIDISLISILGCVNKIWTMSIFPISIAEINGCLWKIINYLMDIVY